MIDPKQGYWIVKDSYPETNEETIQAVMAELHCSREEARFTKLLDFNFGFNFVKRIYIGVQNEPQQKQDYLTYLIENAQVWLIYLQETISSLFASGQSQKPQSDNIPATSSYTNLPPPNPPNPPILVAVVAPATTTDWARAGKEYEGWSVIPPSRSCKNQNPGNLRFTPFVKDVLGATGADKDNFAIFPSYEIGFQALVKFLNYAVQDRLKNYHPNMSIYNFYSVYAPAVDNNSPLKYAKYVAKQCGLSINDPISKFHVS